MLIKNRILSEVYFVDVVKGFKAELSISYERNSPPYDQKFREAKAANIMGWSIFKTPFTGIDAFNARI